MTDIYFITAIKVVGVIAMVCAIYTLSAELVWVARWKFSAARKIQQAAKLGWNTGEMPDGTWFIVLEWMREHPRRISLFSDYRWSVMQRRGARVYTANGGMNEPVGNVLGWMRIERKQDGDEPS